MNEQRKIELLSAKQKINRIMEQISALYSEAEEIGVGYQVSFRYEGPAGYGDSGYFDPNGVDAYDPDEVKRWQPSSGSC